MDSTDRPAFAHPGEREFAGVLDAHGVVWLYEPHMFVLERDPGGAIREAFTPDFYLPELDLYVECTVMRQTAREPEATEGEEGTAHGGCDGRDPVPSRLRSSRAAVGARGPRTCRDRARVTFG